MSLVPILKPSILPALWSIRIRPKRGNKPAVLVLLPLLLTCTCGNGQSPPKPDAAASKTPIIGNCPVFPADNIWNTRVDKLPLDPHSAAYMKSIGLDKPLHPDFGSAPNTGIPFNIVPGNTRKVTVEVFPDESDLAPVPIPENPLLEGSEDNHLIVIDEDACKLYELYAVKRLPNGGWKADSAAHYDLRSNALRPDGWTSADAAGRS